MRNRERIEGLIDAEQMDFLYWYADKHGVSRNEALRDAINDGAVFKKIEDDIYSGQGDEYLRECAEARTKLARRCDRL